MEGSFIRFRLESKKPHRRITGPETKRRTKTGCLTCRMRRKKCDELKPSCVACRRNHLPCKWPDTSPTSEEGSSTDTSEGKKVSRQLVKASPSEGLDLSYVLSSLPSEYQIGDYYLLQHYLYVTSHQLSGREQTQNPFLEHLMPLALRDSKVLEGVLAVSGAHLSSDVQRFENDARSHYAVTLRSVKYTLLAWPTLDTLDLISLLTTTLLLCYFEVGGTGSSKSAEA